MCHGLGSEFVVRQCTFTLLDGEAPCAGEHPLVVLPEADAAVAVHNGGYLWELGVELECSAVTVAMVGLELGG